MNENPSQHLSVTKAGKARSHRPRCTRRPTPLGQRRFGLFRRIRAV